MSHYSIQGNKFSPWKNVLKCAFAIILQACLVNCSSSDDYEIFAKIQGTVTNYQTGAPLENASVTLSPSGFSQQTDANGNYQFTELDAQQYTVTVQKSGYKPNRKTITAISGETQQVDIQLTVIPQ